MDIAAGIIIAISAATALMYSLRYYVNRLRSKSEKETSRLRLAGGLLLALDFEVGSNILKTNLVPSPNELSILAVVVGIRIVLSWSLSKEIDRHNVDLLESGKQPIAERKTTTIFSYIKNRQEGGGREDKSSHNHANSKSSASEKEQ
jgi:uncharacterized membrane protein